MLDLLVPAFVTLFVVIDPIGLAPLFIALTQGMTGEERNRVGLRALVIAFALLAAFGLFGEQAADRHRHRHAGVPHLGRRPAVPHGGRHAVRAAQRPARATRAETRRPPDPSVFPLAMPLIAGPGRARHDGPALQQHTRATCRR